MKDPLSSFFPPIARRRRYAPAFGDLGELSENDAAFRRTFRARAEILPSSCEDRLLEGTDGELSENVACFRGTSAACDGNRLLVFSDRLLIGELFGATENFSARRRTFRRDVDLFGVTESFASFRRKTGGPRR